MELNMMKNIFGLIDVKLGFQPAELAVYTTTRDDVPG